MAEHPPPSAPWFTPLSDNFSPSPMDGVAELVLESGQLLARRPRLSTRYSCPSRLDKLDAQCDEEEEEEEGDRRACVKKRNSDMLIDSHVVPEYKETENSLNNDIVPKVPDDHQVQNRNEFGVGWGPFGRILQQQNQHQHQHQHQNHPDQNEPRLHNFTHFLRPSRLLRPDGRQSTNSCSTSSTNGPNSSTRLDRLTQSASGKTPPVESTLVESGSRSVKALGNQLGLLATEAVSDDRAKKIVAAKDENREQPGANASICSLAASNNLGRHQVSSNGEKGRKRKRRSAEIHSQSEKKRRAKINKKLSMLQDLIPNANKVDKASLLDDAIEYLKTLQLQLQMMAMGRGLMMHPMMLPSMQPPPMAQGMGLGMGMNMPMGLGCIPNPFSSASPALPNPFSSASPALGLPGQILPVPMPQMQSFGHLPTGVLSSSSNPVIPMPGVELLGSAPAMMSSRDAFQNINHESMNIDHKKAG